jgi:plasmid stability protein
MASLTIRDLDDSLKQDLRLRAARHSRSMEEEVRQILRAVLQGSPPAEGNALAWSWCCRRAKCHASRPALMTWCLTSPRPQARRLGANHQQSPSRVRMPSRSVKAPSKAGAQSREASAEAQLPC